MEDGDETGLKEFLGYVVAAQPLAQLFFRYPLFFEIKLSFHYQACSRIIRPIELLRLTLRWGS